MKASTWTPLLPEKPGPERERLILQAVQDQHIVHDWHVLEVHSRRGRAIQLCVSRDALRVGEPGDAVRVTVTARTLWQIADVMAARPLTPQLADIIHREAGTRVPPVTRTWWRDGSMALTRRMLEQSQAVDEVVAGASGLVSGQCKDWVVCKALSRTKAANYGWHVRQNGHAGVTPGARVLQPLASAHNWDHTDYSQGIRLVSRAVKVDGMHVDLDAVLADEDLADALSHEGPLSVLTPDALEPDTLPAPPPRPSSTTMPAVKQGDHPGVPLIVTPNRRPRNGAILWVVIHTAEMAEVPNGAENLAKWVAGPNRPRASWHYAVDCDSIVQSVPEREASWHAGRTANNHGVGVELDGRAEQTAAQWHDEYSRKTLRLAAGLVAGICKRCHIPVRKLNAAELQAKQMGICGHHDINLAFRETDHTDPGPNFPWDEFLEMVRQAA